MLNEKKTQHKLTTAKLSRSQPEVDAQLYILRPKRNSQHMPQSAAPHGQLVATQGLSCSLSAAGTACIPGMMSPACKESFACSACVTNGATLALDHHSNCTAAMPGIFSRSFCVTATRTVMTLAAGPVILILTMGPSMLSNSSSPPPVPTRYGRISLSTCRNPQQMQCVEAIGQV